MALHIGAVASDWDDDVGERLSAARDRRTLTPNTQKVLDALSRANGPMKAYALLEELYDDGLRAPMTIYRALDALIERGLARKIASINAFVAVHANDAGSSTAYVTCRRCGETRAIKLDSERIRDLFGSDAFASDDMVIEVSGECRGEGCDAS